MMITPAPLTIRKVYKALQDIASESGNSVSSFYYFLFVHYANSMTGNEQEEGEDEGVVSCMQGLRDTVDREVFAGKATYRIG